LGLSGFLMNSYLRMASLVAALVWAVPVGHFVTQSRAVAATVVDTLGGYVAGISGLLIGGR